MKKIILFIFISIATSIFSQDKSYVIDLLVRNKAIEFMNQANAKIEKNDYPSALNLILKSIKTDSLLRQNYDALYKTIIPMNNHSDSILSIFLKAKNFFEEDDEICYYSAEIYRMRNNYKAAINEYTQAINYSKNIPEKSFYFKYFYINRAISNLKLNNYALAETDFTTVLSFDAQNITALINRGICYYNLKKITEAKNDWLKAEKSGSAIASSYLKKLNQSATTKYVN